jgi:hypothetical protein
MKHLPTTLQKRGFTYHQLKASTRAYLYEQRDTATNKLIGFVTFLHQEDEITGEVLWPIGTDYGTKAFVFSKREKAEMIYSGLNR